MAKKGSVVYKYKDTEATKCCPKNTVPGIYNPSDELQ
jgi:hypothetical protein